MLLGMDYVKFLPAYMISKKYEGFKATYEKYESLYTVMRASRDKYPHLNEIEYSDKLEYYRRMSTVYKNKAGICRRYGNIKNKEK
jgi:hypothetical protein